MLGVNLLLFGMKLFLPCSRIKAVDIHSLADVVAPAAVMVCLVIARRKTRVFS